VTHDLFFWKPKTRSAYLCLCEGVPCGGVARFPRGKLVRALVGAFGDEPPFELDAQDTHAHITLPSGATGIDVLNTVARLAAAEALVMYDPQADPPTEADEALAERLAREATPEPEEPTVEDDLRDAQAGDAAAMNNLATRHFEGDGVPRDFTSALLWYRRSAEKGSVVAMLNLADCHRRGQGVEKDGAEAVRWCMKGLELEQCVSAFTLGEMYAEGDCVEPSLDEAERYFTLARANRHPEAYLALKRIGRAPRD
jgi:hypothetical protein